FAAANWKTFSIWDSLPTSGAASAVWANCAPLGIEDQGPINNRESNISLKYEPCFRVVLSRGEVISMNNIDSFKDEYRFLSNFYPAPVQFDGIRFPTVEHAYQFARTLDQEW